MSKFTKALEKIQEQKREKQDSSEKRKPTFAIPQELQERMRYWGQGVRTVKNTKPDSRIVAHHFPHSIISEQYRMLRTNLKNQLTKEGAKVLLISSSVHAEGKTITAANLAISLAEMEDCKVALIDADLRRGKVTDYLGLGKNLPGLANLLSEELTPKQVMVRNSLENLLIMPRGKIVKNPSELVESRKFGVLISELRNHFDYILIDSPPIMSVADPSIMARETDGLLMVIQSGKTPKNVLAQAHLLFKQAGVKILGYILTNVEYQSPDARYYYHNYYYYGETERKKQFKDMVQIALRTAEKGFSKLEEKFNGWWEKKVLKIKK